MEKSKFIEEQIAFALKQSESFFQLLKREWARRKIYLTGTKHAPMCSITLSCSITRSDDTERAVDWLR